MKIRPMFTTWLCTVLCSLVVVNASIAADTTERHTKRRAERERARLRGLPGVEVLIEGMGPDVERAGLTGTQLRTDVELRLRKAGIKVLTEEEWLATPGNPYLYVNVNLLKLSGYLF